MGKLIMRVIIILLLVIVALVGTRPVGVMFYIILLFAVIELIVFIKKRTARRKSRIGNGANEGKYNIFDFNDHFSLILDNTLSFIDAYRAEFPGEWIFIIISIAHEKSEFSTDTYRHYEYFVEFKVSVGCWYNGILPRSKDAKEFMETIYTFDTSDNAFSYRIRIGNSTDCVIPQDIINKNFFACIDAYDREHPNRRLTRTPYGILHKWN